MAKSSNKSLDSIYSNKETVKTYDASESVMKPKVVEESHEAFTPKRRPHTGKSGLKKYDASESPVITDMKKKARCWSGYEPVPGKEPYSDGSCRPAGGKKKEKKKEKKAALSKMSAYEFGRHMFEKRAIAPAIGGLVGMQQAPSEEEKDLSMARGAVRGIGTGVGAFSGGGLGALGGGVLGLLLARFGHKPTGSLALNRITSNLNNIHNANLSAQSAVAGGTLGGLAGGIYGGYKGNKGTKALLDKMAPLDEEDDE